MRWQRLTPDEKRTAREARKATWHRQFAWLPAWDIESRTVYWLEHVWRKRVSRDKDNRAPWVYSYRGGRYAPEVKTAPPLPSRVATTLCQCEDECRGCPKNEHCKDTNPTGASSHG